MDQYRIFKRVDELRDDLIKRIESGCDKLYITNDEDALLLTVIGEFISWIQIGTFNHSNFEKENLVYLGRFLGKEVFLVKDELLLTCLESGELSK